MRLYRLAVLAIGVKEKKENRERDMKCIEDSSSSSSSSSQTKSSVGGNLARTLEPPSLAEAWKLRTACCNNLAACHFQVIFHFCLKFFCLSFSYPQWGNHASVVQLSTVVLQADSNQVNTGCTYSHHMEHYSEPGFQVKALYRRGVSYLELKEFDFAERDLVAAHKVEPSNRYQQFSIIPTRKYSLASQNLGIRVLLKT